MAPGMRFCSQGNNTFQLLLTMQSPPGQGEHSRVKEKDHFTMIVLKGDFDVRSCHYEKSFALAVPEGTIHFARAK